MCSFEMIFTRSYISFPFIVQLQRLFTFGFYDVLIFFKLDRPIFYHYTVLVYNQLNHDIGYYSFTFIHCKK